LIETAGRGREDGKSKAETLERGVRNVIRTIWFASFGVALVGGLFATKVVSATVLERPVVAGDPAAPGIALLR
jgi:hypothetical protein